MMKPPAPRHPANSPARSLREQAMLGNAATASRPPLAPGTILEDVVGSSATGGSSVSDRPDNVLPVWSDFFDRTQEVQLPERGGSFRVYLAGDKGPVLFCLHGGGYTGLTWAVCAKQLALQGYRVAALDMRGHGETTASPCDDLSLGNLVEDATAVWQALYGQEKPPTVVIGHSMGGAVAVHAAKSKIISPVAGIVVIDVVEGSAMAALPFMVGVLNQRPRSFASLQEAVRWAAASGLCKHESTAAITVPPMLTQHPQQRPAGTSVPELPDSNGSAAFPSIAEDEELQTGADAIAHAPDQPDAAESSLDRWHWRTHLQGSQRYWEGWYRGLSDAFLSVPAAKVLIIADTNRLDTPLTIGQMQGKFQQVLLPQAGHAVHEDNAEQVADVLLKFLKRHRVGEPPLTFPRPARPS